MKNTLKLLSISFIFTAVVLVAEGEIPLKAGAGLAVWTMPQIVAKAEVVAKVEDWKLSKTLPEHKSIIRICYSPDGKKMITSNRWNPEIIIRNANTLEKLAEISIPLWLQETGKPNIERVEFNKDGTKIVGFADHGLMLVWDAVSFQLIAMTKADTGLFWTPSFNPDKTKLITGSHFDSKECLIRDGESFKHLGIISSNSKNSFICRAEFSADGSLIATIKDLGNEIEIWSTNSYEKIGSIQSDSAVNKAAKFSPDGSKIIVLNSQTLSVWDAQTFQQLAAFPTLDKVNGFYEVLFSPDGAKLIASDSGKVRIWDTKSLEQIKELNHAYHFSISQDSKKLVTANYQGDNVSIWDTTTFNKIAQFDAANKTNKDEHVTSVHFSQDSKKVFIASYWNAPLQIWEPQANQSDIPLRVK